MGSHLFPPILLCILLGAGEPAESTPAEPEAGEVEPSAEKTESPAEEPASRPPVALEEKIVVTASRSEESLLLAPSAITILDAEAIEATADTDLADLLRRVPGLNVTRLSARDMNLSARGPTTSIDSSMLVLVDGRSIYLDFFGIVMWDLVPSDPEELERVEVLRGPGSAVWGANALAGVVNLITKDPEDLPGMVRVAAGEMGALSGSFMTSGAGERTSWKATGSYYRQDPWPRDTTPFPSGWEPPDFDNEGTHQPRFNFRLDRTTRGGAKLRWGIGGAATSGLIHSGIGPFDVENGSSLLFSQLRYEREDLSVGAFLNVLNGDARNLLNALSFAFDTWTLDAEIRGERSVGSRSRLLYGGNLRHNGFDITLAPGGDRRDEAGAYVQGEMFLGKRTLLTAGLRADYFNTIGLTISPRTAVVVELGGKHSLRFTYGRAFKAPTFMMNHLGTEFENIERFPTLEIRFPIEVQGNPDLDEARMDSLEIGYRGSLGRHLALDTALYWTRMVDALDLYAAEYHSALDGGPPAWWPLHPSLFPEDTFPSLYTYRNLATVENRGFEVGLEAAMGRRWRGHFTWSWQDMPRVRDIGDITDYNENFPPRHRISFGADYDGSRWLLSMSAHYTDRAYWTDVLDSRFYAWTDTWWRFNARATWKSRSDRLRISMGGTNLNDDRTPQHAFGDLIGRQVTGELTWRF
jgi:iron complex outermembrane receptor protein